MQLFNRTMTITTDNLWAFTVLFDENFEPEDMFYVSSEWTENKLFWDNTEWLVWFKDKTVWTTSELKKIDLPFSDILEIQELLKYAEKLGLLEGYFKTVNNE